MQVVCLLALRGRALAMTDFAPAHIGCGFASKGVRSNTKRPAAFCPPCAHRKVPVLLDIGGVVDARVGDDVRRRTSRCIPHEMSISAPLSD